MSFFEGLVTLWNPVHLTALQHSLSGGLKKGFDSVIIFFLCCFSLCYPSALLALLPSSLFSLLPSFILVFDINYEEYSLKVFYIYSESRIHTEL
jgi:hypothetical protein